MLNSMGVLNFWTLKKGRKYLKGCENALNFRFFLKVLIKILTFINFGFPNFFWAIDDMNYEPLCSMV